MLTEGIEEFYQSEEINNKDLTQMVKVLVYGSRKQRINTTQIGKPIKEKHIPPKQTKPTLSMKEDSSLASSTRALHTPLGGELWDDQEPSCHL